jgi:hypothetical protein
MNRFRKFVALPARDRLLLLEACLNLGLARICVWAVPFRFIARTMCIRSSGSVPPDLSPDQLRLARNIRWTIRLAARHVPWNAVCLPQSLAARLMLKRRGIPATLYFGVRKSPSGARELEAHAWVLAGLIEVTPRQEPENFVVIATFS